MTSPRFLAVDDVADELAISNGQVYTLRRTGDLPAIQVGPKKVWRIDRAKLEDYIARQYEASSIAVSGDQQSQANCLA